LQKIAELTTMVAVLGQSSAPALDPPVAPNSPVSAAGTPLLEALERKGFTQQGLARALGVELQRVHKWVSGEAVPVPLRCLQIAQELDEPVIALWPNAQNGEKGCTIAALASGKEAV
jgi:DNA-binding XRE family transcriptional regulator